MDKSTVRHLEGIKDWLRLRAFRLICNHSRDKISKVYTDWIIGFLYSIIYMYRPSRLFVKVGSILDVFIFTLEFYHYRTLIGLQEQRMLGSFVLLV